MKVGLIGHCGHSGTALKRQYVDKGIEWVAYSKSYPEEDMSDIEERFRTLEQMPKAYTNYQEMLAKEALDIVVIDGIYGEHAKMICEALTKKIHVYCDKPLATTRKELLEVERALQQSQVKLWAMMTSRFDPWFYTAKKLVEQGKIGKVRMVNGQKSYKLGKRKDFYKERQTYGGTIPWVAIHSIDLILWITGKKCVEINARHNAIDNKDHGMLEMIATCQMVLEDDILATVHADYYRPNTAPSHGDDRLRIVGTNGVIEVQGEKVTMINEDKEGVQDIACLESGKIFEAFLAYVKNGEIGLITEIDSLYSTEVALIARESADSLR